MTIEVVQVNAFTHDSQGGNPAGVCLLDEARDSAWMQALAAEMGFAETAFLIPGEDLPVLRWFTPSTEVDLCGHATLATARLIFERAGKDGASELRFRTRSGVLTAQRRGDWIDLDFPSVPALSCETPPGLEAALGLAPEWTGRNRDDLLVLSSTEAEVCSLRPDMSAIAALGERGIIVTAVSSRPEFDFVSRFFAPAVGVDEDEVTGSAHCCLAPFWAERLGRSEMVGFQCSTRGGIVKVRLRDDRVILSGQSSIVERHAVAR